MKKFLFGCALLSLSAIPASASDMNFNNPGMIWGMQNGVVLFESNGARLSAPPACATQTTRFAIDASTVTGQAAVSILLSAKAMGKRVYVAGSGACTVWGDTETILYVAMEG